MDSDFPLALKFVIAMLIFAIFCLVAILGKATYEYIF